MKKIYLTLALITFSAFNTNASTLFFENNNSTNSVVCIQSIQLNTLGGLTYEYYDHYFGLSLKPNTTVVFTDNDPNNYQFPFLNVYPFINNVWEEYGNGTSSVANLPLPQTQDNVINSLTRYRLQSIKFKMDNDIGRGTGPAWNSSTSSIIGQNFSADFSYYYLGNNESYNITYARFYDKHYLIFMDN